MLLKEENNPKELHENIYGLTYSLVFCQRRQDIIHKYLDMLIHYFMKPFQDLNTLEHYEGRSKSLG